MLLYIPSVCVCVCVCGHGVVVQTPGGVPATLRTSAIIPSSSFSILFFVVERQSRKKLGSGDMAGIKHTRAQQQQQLNSFFILF
jgi:hypothetical protein